MSELKVGDKVILCLDLNALLVEEPENLLEDRSVFRVVEQEIVAG